MIIKNISCVARLETIGAKAPQRIEYLDDLAFVFQMSENWRSGFRKAPTLDVKFVP